MSKNSKIIPNQHELLNILEEKDEIIVRYKHEVVSRKKDS